MHRVPGVAEPIDTLAVEHEQAVLHDVHLDLRQRGARLVGKDIHRQIEGGVVGQQRLQTGVGIAVKRYAFDILFAADRQPRRLAAFKWGVALLEHIQPRGGLGTHRQFGIGRDVGVTAGCQHLLFAAGRPNDG